MTISSAEILTGMKAGIETLETKKQLPSDEVTVDNGRDYRAAESCQAALVAPQDSKERLFYCICRATYPMSAVRGRRSFVCPKCNRRSDIFEITKRLLPAASLAAGFHAPSDDGALPRSHGRREDATDAASQEAASRRRGDSSQTPPPPGAEWNVPPDAPRTWSPQVMVDRWCDLIARNLATLADYVADHKDGLNLSETMRNLERIDEERRRITLAGISDTHAGEGAGMKSREFRELGVGSRRVETDNFRRVVCTNCIIKLIDEAAGELSEQQFQVMLDELASDIVSRQAFSDFDEGDDD